jgi:hypothetical protein
MNKIRAEHLSRLAYVYVRQSTLDQVQHNRESQLRQYGLADRARGLGWSDVTVIDDDISLCVRNSSPWLRAAARRAL